MEYIDAKLLGTLVVFALILFALFYVMGAKATTTTAKTGTITPINSVAA